ncbi:mini-chromosome maintenance complex-binding protein isoform X1 [Neodiprion virginianus]|uniref:mini-chromosome maintenance complex-binding protein isoform X1 n=1 Tax=Neodiprion virginianus TaxID=2961670 RepID=UPI001EE6A521|nr:mini-chromosome maintenance complex-binding protein isoform X1 [Neodiprion virginianus]
MTANNIVDWTPDFFLANEANCRLVLSETANRLSVPSLNSIPLHSFKDKQLARFRGMIQDTYNPEYYLDRFQIRNVATNETTTCRGRYRDTLDSLPGETVIVDSKENVNAERQTCFVISVPGVNSWAKEKCTVRENAPQVSTNTATKRSLESEEMECVEFSSKKHTQTTPSSGDGEPRLLSREHAMNFPLPNDDGKACIVKIYDETSFKLNQIIDIVGFMSLDPALSIAHDPDKLMDDIEFQSHNPPVSLIPRLHAIDVKDVSMEEVPQTIQGDLTFPVTTRSDLKLVLSQILFGDVLAAEYVICHLISSVYLRRDFLSLGAFPLNITNLPLDKCKTFPEDFYGILSLLLPKSHLIGMTLDELNNLNLQPKKDYDCNRLTSGVLQLSDNTHLVLDETKLTDGQVSANGRKNYEAFSTLINSQTVTYDFKYYTMDFPADIPVLILSESKSMIPCYRQIVLEKNSNSENIYSETLEAVRHYLSDETRIYNIRNWLRVSRRRDIAIETENSIGDVIQKDFVEMRQLDKSTSAEDLHSLMVLARLISMSHGMDKLTVDYWHEAVRMEKERKRRLQR